jgi:hypothetical protein
MLREPLPERLPVMRAPFPERLRAPSPEMWYSS